MDIPCILRSSTNHRRYDFTVKIWSALETGGFTQGPNHDLISQALFAKKKLSILNLVLICEKNLTLKSEMLKWDLQWLFS